MITSFQLTKDLILYGMEQIFSVLLINVANTGERQMGAGNELLSCGELRQHFLPCFDCPFLVTVKNTAYLGMDKLNPFDVQQITPNKQAVIVGRNQIAGVTRRVSVNRDGFNVRENFFAKSESFHPFGIDVRLYGRSSKCSR